MLDEFGTDTLRLVFAQLDRVVYYLSGVVYGFIKDLAGTTVFGSGAISDFSTKIYGVMGIFMLFKVSFSLLTYIVDPDSFSDKGKGMSAIAKNVIIVLIMIILAPFAFDLLGDAQNIILEQGILERFVFDNGTGGDHISQEKRKFQMNKICGDKKATAASDGHYVALQVFKGFYQPELNHYSEEEVRNELEGTDYCYHSDDATVGSFLSYKVYTAAEPGSGDNDYYTVDYMFLWSTITGVVLLLLFVNVCIEIAKRAVKLGFLQLIAPIPIISYVDPKSGKDGMFKKWLKELGSTWASLFIRLGAIYFAVRIIQYVCENISENSDHIYSGIFMKVFIILGCLLFAKELPKLIEKLVPGLNMSGSFNLNPLKNIRENALGYNYAAGAASAGLGFLGGLGANAWASHKNNNKVRDKYVNKADFQDENGNWIDKKGYKNALASSNYKSDKEFMSRRSSVASAVAGAHSAGFRSFWRTSKDGKIVSGASGGISRSSEVRNQRDNYNNQPGPFAYGRGRIAARAHEVAGIKNDYGVYGQNDEQIKQLRNREQEFSTYETRARERQMDYAQSSGINMNAFLEGFKRENNGLGELGFNLKDSNGKYKYEGDYDYERYLNMMKEVNNGKAPSEAVTVFGAQTFEEYLQLDNNTHYLNQQHESVKKELNKQEKMFASNVKNNK